MLGSATAGETKPQVSSKCEQCHIRFMSWIAQLQLATNLTFGFPVNFGLCSETQVRKEILLF